MASFDYDVVIIGSGFGESVAAPFRGVLPLPISALKSGRRCCATWPTATERCR
jgi:hypothetical protein